MHDYDARSCYITQLNQSQALQGENYFFSRSFNILIEQETLTLQKSRGKNIEKIAQEIESIDQTYVHTLRFYMKMLFCAEWKKNV